MNAPLPSLAVIACRVFEAEVAALARGATHIVRQESFEIGLHDQPALLRARLAEAIAGAEADAAVEAVVLVYGLCGLALADLAPMRCPLVVARAHDCITLFLGSKERYAACMRDEPGTYWYSPGWNRDRRVAGPDREAKLRADYTEKFGADDAEALLEMERASFAHHRCAGYTDHGLPGDRAQRRYAEDCARSLGWRFEHHAGDPTLLRDLLYGPWDNGRFLVVQPGERIAHSADASVVKTIPIAALNRVRSGGFPNTTSQVSAIAGGVPSPRGFEVRRRRARGEGTPPTESHPTHTTSGLAAEQAGGWGVAPPEAHHE